MKQKTTPHCSSPCTVQVVHRYGLILPGQKVPDPDAQYCFLVIKESLSPGLRLHFLVLTVNFMYR